MRAERRAADGLTSDAASGGDRASKGTAEAAGVLVRHLARILRASVVTVVLAGCSLVSGAASPPSAQLQREALIGSFIEAVQRNDAAAIAAMTDPLVDPRADIAALLEASGGRPWTNVQVAWGPDDFGGKAIHARITATTPDGVSSMKVLTVWDTERATLALGSAPGIDRGSDTASPQR